jgi:hypothetical protein
MPVILATWEAKIGRIEVPGQPWQKSLKDLVSVDAVVCVSSQLQQEA